MNAQAIVSKIEQDARDTAGQLRADAQAKAEALKAASREKINAMHQTMLSQAGKDSESLEQRLLRMAELDDRKDLLGMKRALIDEAFAMAGEKLKNAPAEKKRSFFLQTVVDYANGNETLIIGAKDTDWFDEGFVSDANAALSKAGKKAALTLAPEQRADSAGVILVSGGAEIKCTFAALLDEVRVGMEQQVAETLFGKA